MFCSLDANRQIGGQYIGSAGTQGLYLNGYIEDIHNPIGEMIY